MIVHSVVQGSPEWLALRTKYRPASKAPVMMGASKHQSRNELLRETATGAVEEVDADRQYLFDKGHAAEKAARPLVEAMIADELFPTTATDDDGYLLASYDGITMAADIGYECKLWNESLAAAVRANDLPPMYYWQLEQQILVGGLEKIIFVCSDGTPEKFVSMEYRPVPGRAQALMAGWKQFDADLANYKPVEVIPAAVAAPQMQLPALSIQVTGSIALVDNLKVFGERLESFISGLNLKPADDQAFANAEAAIKTLGTAETALEAAKASALAQTASIDEMTRTVALYSSQARTTRLMLEKLVKQRKESIRVEIVQGGKDALTAHIAGLNKRIGKNYMPPIAADFAGAAKGKRTIASLRDAVDTELARAKIEANATADRISININAQREYPDHGFLFSDVATLVLKAPDDFLALVKMRIADHKAAEAKRLEQEREKIRAEEQAKLLREQQERERRERIEAEKAKEKAAAQELPAVSSASRQGESASSCIGATGRSDSNTPKPDNNPVRDSAQQPAPAAPISSTAAPPSVSTPPPCVPEAPAAAGTQRDIQAGRLILLRFLDEFGRYDEFLPIARRIEDFLATSVRRAA